VEDGIVKNRGGNDTDVRHIASAGHQAPE